MKKIISLILLFIITLSACSHSPEIPVGSGPLTAKETTPPETTTEEETRLKIVNTSEHFIVNPVTGKEIVSSVIVFVSEHRIDKHSILKMEAYPELQELPVYHVSEHLSYLLDENGEKVLDEEGNIKKFYFYSITFVEKYKFETIDCIKEMLSEREDCYRVMYAIRNESYYLNSFQSIPSDYPSVENKKWGAELINLPEAWDIRTNSTVRIGVIDSGVQLSHEDLTNNLDPDSVSFNGTSAYTDYIGHGTQVTGVLAAVGNNNIGISGVCWSANVMSLKIDADSTVETLNSLISAINYADSEGIKILNMSIAYDLDRLSARLNEAEINQFIANLKNAIQNFDGLVVCAAGNDNEEICETYKVYPACFKLPNLISVGALNQENKRADYSNFSNQYVDIFAPGDSIYTTYAYETEEEERYYYVSGTSFAAPYVTGLAALLLSQNPNMTPADLKTTILENAQTVLCDGVNELEGLCVTGKCLDAAAALSNPIIHSSHTDSYEFYDSTGHGNFCICGNLNINSHNYSYDPIDINYHKKTCNCGYSAQETHEWELTYVNSLSELSPNAIPIYKCFACGMTSLTNPELMSE